MPRASRLFLRFGPWEANEDGLAVFRARYDARRHSYIYAPAGPEERHNAIYDNWRGPLYLVRGEEIGHGENGAVLLRNVRIVGYIMAVCRDPSFGRPAFTRVPKRLWETLHHLRGGFPYLAIYLFDDRIGFEAKGIFASE